MNEGWEEKLESFYYSSALTGKYRGNGGKMMRIGRIALGRAINFSLELMNQ